MKTPGGYQIIQLPNGITLPNGTGSVNLSADLANKMRTNKPIYIAPVELTITGTPSTKAVISGFATLAYEESAGHWFNLGQASLILDDNNSLTITLNFS